MVSAAKVAGGLAALYIDSNAVTCPWPLAQAISHALTILSWMELSEEDRPPESIWLESDQIEAHFNDVKQRWADKAGGNEAGSSRLVENELTKGIRDGR